MPGPVSKVPVSDIMPCFLSCMQLSDHNWDGQKSTPDWSCALVAIVGRHAYGGSKAIIVQCHLSESQQCVSTVNLNSNVTYATFQLFYCSSGGSDCHLTSQTRCMIRLVMWQPNQYRVVSGLMRLLDNTDDLLIWMAS